MSGLALGPRFDYYAATVRADPSDLLRELARELGGEVVSGKPRQGYTLGSHIKVKSSNVLTVYSGGRNGNPHVFASGDDTDAFVPVIRSITSKNGRACAAFPHHVTRMDAAIDYDGPGTWDRLYSIAEELALDPTGARRRRSKLSVSQAGDWLRLEAGRTFYIGAPSSAVRVRLYEKGKQLRGLALDGGDDISPDLVRLEVQVRPDGNARHRAVTADPLDAFGYSEWSRELLELVEHEAVERVHIRERRETDHERAMFWLVRQYGDHILRELELCGGDWSRLGDSLAYRIARAHGDVADPGGETDTPWLRQDDFLRTPPTDRPF